MVSKDSKIAAVAVQFFTDLFSTDQNQICYDELFHGAPFNTLSVAQQRLMDAPFTSKDIHDALKSMHPTKAPEPDGIHAKFFQTQWGHCWIIYHSNAVAMFK